VAVNRNLVTKPGIGVGGDKRPVSGDERRDFGPAREVGAVRGGVVQAVASGKSQVARETAPTPTLSLRGKELSS